MRVMETKYYERLSYESVLADLEWTPRGCTGLGPHVKYLASHIEKVIGEATFQRIGPSILKEIVQSPFFNGSSKTYGIVLCKLKEADPEVQTRRRAFAKMGAKDYVAFISNEKIDLNKHRKAIVDFVAKCRIEPRRSEDWESLETSGQLEEIESDSSGYGTALPHEFSSYESGLYDSDSFL